MPKIETYVVVKFIMAQKQMSALSSPGIVAAPDSSFSA